MRILGLLFILFGILLCFTFFFFAWGIAAVIAGAVLCIAGRSNTPGPVAKIVHGVLMAVIAIAVIGGALFWYGCASGAFLPAPAIRRVQQQNSQPQKPAKKPAKKAGSQNLQDPAHATR